MTAYTGAPSGGLSLSGIAVSWETEPKIPVSDIQRLDVGSTVTLFVLDTTMLGGTFYYFSPNVNEYGAGITWKDLSGKTQVYTPFPIDASGFDRNTGGTQARPTIGISNIDGLVGGLVRDYGDLTGARVVRRRVVARYLDLANFVPGSPMYAACTPDRMVHLADDEFDVERKAAETPLVVQFELSSAFDSQGVQVPRRVVIRNLCQWIYLGTDELTACPYSGALPTCAKTLAACKEHYPAVSGVFPPLPFGGFSGARR